MHIRHRGACAPKRHSHVRASASVYGWFSCSCDTAAGTVLPLRGRRPLAERERLHRLLRSMGRRRAARLPLELSRLGGAGDEAASGTAAAAVLGLGPPVGEFGRRYTGGGCDGAVIGHQDAPPRGEGARAPPANSAGARVSGGSKGGGAIPRQPLPGTREAWPQRVGWLSPRKAHRAPRADALEAAPGAPLEAAVGGCQRSPGR